MKAIVPGFSRGRDDYSDFLKRCALFYKCIEMPSTDEAISRALSYGKDYIAADIQYSVNVGFCASIKDEIYKLALENEEVSRYRDRYFDLSDAKTPIGKAAMNWSRHHDKTHDQYSQEYYEAMAPVQNKLLPVYDFEYHSAIARTAAVEIQSLETSAEVFMFNTELKLSDRFHTKKARVYRVIFDKMSLPKREVPLNEIIDFQKQNNLHLLRLKRWVKEAASKDMSLPELADEIEYLLQTYETSIRRNGWAGATGVLEFVIVSSADFLESALKLRFKKLAELGFKIVNAHQALLEREASFEGAQLSYLYKVQNI